MIMFKNICWAQKLFMLMVAGLFILSVSSMLAGCGNKGGLFLPDNELPDKNSTTEPKNNKKS
jgi:predicted small lipoprotein YifL